MWCSQLHWTLEPWFPLSWLVIFNPDCLFYQNKLQLTRKNPTRVLSALCLRVRRGMEPVTQWKTTLCLLKISASHGSVWWRALSIFVPAVWDESNGSIRLLKGPPRKGKAKKVGERSHETFRLLRRKNLIVEAVRSFKVIEGLFPSVNVISYF